jgi:hypothetical protein
MVARVSVSFADGKALDVAHDLADRLPMDLLEHGLRNKAKGLLGVADAEMLWSSISRLDRLSARDIAQFLRIKGSNG